MITQDLFSRGCRSARALRIERTIFSKTLGTLCAVFAEVSKKLHPNDWAILRPSAFETALRSADPIYCPQVGIRASYLRVVVLLHESY
jgi:hypothetical protein